jgi:hypothetical protein
VRAFWESDAGVEGGLTGSGIANFSRCLLAEPESRLRPTGLSRAIQFRGSRGCKLGVFVSPRNSFITYY